MILISLVVFLIFLMVICFFGVEMWRFIVSEMIFSVGVVVGGVLIVVWGGFCNCMYIIVLVCVLYGLFMIGFGIVLIFIMYLVFNFLIGIMMLCFNILVIVLL